MEMLEQKEGRLIVHLPGELDHHHTENIRAAVDHMIPHDTCRRSGI